MPKNDFVSNVLFSIAATAMAPVEATVQLATDGDVKSETADRLIKGAVSPLDLDASSDAD